MNKLNELEDIYLELISIYQNIKAEIIVAELQENSELSENDIIISNKSTFNRPFRRDIISIDNISILDKIILNLSRSGLYDYLPEGLFHSGSTKKELESNVSKRKKQKKQEQDARIFFAPIENEFFKQRLLIECNERELLNDFYSFQDDFLINFWEIDKSIPKNYLVKLIKLLPYSHKIIGDFELTRLSLEKILGEKVHFKKGFSNIMIESENKESNDFKLGVNLVLNSTYTKVLSPLLEVTIGPISESIINNFVKKDRVMKFINNFYNYFIPLEYDVKTQFIVPNKNSFQLGNVNSAIIGISTNI